MTVLERITTKAASLSAAERRVAEAVLADPEAVAFGTVAELARRASTSGPSVVRFANRIGFDGYVGLQAAVQRELTGRLRPAGERIREARSRDVVARTLQVELDNVRRTLSAIDPEAFRRAVTCLAARRGRVVVLPGGASQGVAKQFTDELTMLRAGVELAWGPTVYVTGILSDLSKGDTLVAIDLPRYDRAVLDAVTRARATGASIITLTDSLLSPLARLATASFAVGAEGSGPFDSHLGALAVANALVAGVADRLRSTATERIDHIEAAWQEADALLD